MHDPIGIAFDDRTGTASINSRKKLHIRLAYHAAVVWGKSPARSYFWGEWGVGGGGSWGGGRRPDIRERRKYEIDPIYARLE